MSLFRSKRISVIILILIGILTLKTAPLIITSLIFLLSILYNKNTGKPLKNYKFWIVILVLLVIVPIFTGLQDSYIFGISYSSEQLSKTLLMTLRGISVFLLFQVLTINLNVASVKPLFTKFGLDNFDLLYSLSNNISPKIRSILNARYNLFKVEWKKKRSLESFITFLTDVFSDFLQLSDSLTNIKEESHKVSTNDFIDRYDFNNIPAIYIIVGDAGIGKTPWIEKLIKLLRDNRKTIDGIISKKHIITDDNWYHDLIRISNNEKYQLTTMKEIDTYTKVGKFYFFEDIIDWGNKQLKSITNVDFIIIDEVGLLEFDNKGFIQGLQFISKNYKGNLIITLRSSLRDRFEEFLNNNLSEIVNWSKHFIIL